ncbi:MAG TPA: RnfABCDGE type electron transport complex subunit D [Thermoplasmata archaeon]|nr:RnfABCDGE type electron transport complex subunit D [Thermoplasmata archaeon]
MLLWNGHGLRNFATAEPLLMLPAVAVFADLGFQAARFPRIRIPDAALANGFFLTVILWPTTVSVTLVAVAVVTVGLRHALRIASHPIFNPAAAGVLVAATVFALPQPWHVGATWTDSALVGVLGLILWSKAWPTWRIWGAYFVANAVAVALIADLLAGGRAVAGVLETSVFAATPIFFGLFMVTEPRTAPTARWGMWLFGGLVGSAAAVLPAVFAELPAYSALGVLAPYLALFVGNVVTAALPSARGVHRPTPRPAQGTGPRRAATPGSEPS